jgi:23S rRNA U2552 (ribose-2'-O)-methylase RlmE/FtsJ
MLINKYSNVQLESSNKLNSNTELQLGGNNLELNKDNIVQFIKEFIKNKSKYKLENDLLNIFSNIEKIFYQDAYLNGHHLNMSGLLRNQEIIDKYFLNNMNILVITNLFTNLIPIIYNKKNNNITVDLLLFKHIDISKYNNTIYLKQLTNNKNINTIIGDFNTDIEEINKYNLRKYDLIIINILAKTENENINKIIKISLNNLKKNGKLIKRQTEKINKANEITSLINHFNNYKLELYINYEIFKPSYLIVFSGFNQEELNNNTDKVNKFILENNNIFTIRTNEIDNEINYFKNDPENYINRYFMYLSNLLYNTIFYLDKNKIPYNKYYLTLINNYYQNNINELFSLGNPINQRIIKYKNIDIKSKKKIHKTSKKISKTKQNKDKDISKINVGSYKSYTYNYFDDVIDELSYVKNIRKEITSLHGISYLTKVTKISEDFTRGLSSYLSTKFKLPFKPSNAFTKIWEIYETFNLFDKNQTSYNTFHFAEAPGQFIWGTEYYLKKKNKSTIFDWFANSLNHNHPKNKKIFGNVFGDDYGFIKNFKNKWLYGADNTGDITVSKNVKLIGKQIKEKGIFDVVTGDAGLSTEMDTLFLQKLEFAQLCMVAATASINKNCIVKHFTPFINSDADTNLGGGQFVNMIYLYSIMFKQLYLFKPYTSRSTSGEFYLIGKGFLGVSDVELDKLLHILDNFKINQTYFNKNDIPEEFYRQIFTFINKMSKLNTMIIERQNFFMTCLIEPNEEIRKETKCLKYLEPKTLEKIQIPRYNEWIDMFNFS